MPESQIHGAANNGQTGEMGQWFQNNCQVMEPVPEAEWRGSLWIVADWVRV